MNHDQSDDITFTRNELYEKIWNTPTIKLAKDFGLSDVALGKICKKHSIPKPPLGYWAKLAHGKAVPRPPLPTSMISDSRELKSERDRYFPAALSRRQASKRKKRRFPSLSA